ncbi:MULTISPECIES: ATP-binding protein [Nocardioides]|uniref:ATP-binding protein n=1 Tax=Nocardioides vastitatis TaxID=2568655 RepID=A0ABW0ZBH2_9ACTN|nr:ATP-binding protein [Nocardioides sp.]THJ02364.1 ATP-binding protein [Nocardioides sp.]
MPNRQTLELGPGPRSVHDARRWVVQTCRDIGREELCECAELAISELVTNAVLHGEPPIRMQLRGTPEHPRFEVHDGSTIAPQASTQAGGFDIDAFDLGAFDELDPEQIAALTTVGRGLDIVARASVAWGTEIEEDGKTVWFEPAADLSETGGAPYQLTRSIPPLAEERTRVGEVAVQINGVPVAEFGRFQRHYRDLRREIRLLALAHEDDYPLAKVLSEHFNALERPLRANMGREQVDDARGQGRRTVDLRLRMPRDAARQIGGLTDLLDAADEFSRAQRLLTAPRSPEQRSFQIWFLGEFRRQAAGAAPVSWQGGSGTGAPSRAL